MLKFIPAVALALAVSPAFAQAPATYEVTSLVLLKQAVACEGMYNELSTRLSQQVKDLTAERDALKKQVTDLAPKAKPE